MGNTLAAKIVKASLEVGALSTDKTNTAQNYNYISADKVLERAGDALANAGVVIIPSIVHEETVKLDYTDNYNKTKSRFDSTVHFSMLITDGETQLEIPWRGRGNDFAVPDKALYKAITSGHKYFLMKLLNVGVGNEDGDHESAEESSQQGATDAQRKPQQQAVRPPSAQRQQAPQAQHRSVDTSTGEITSNVNPFDDAPMEGPNDAELAILGTWQSPQDAQVWAVEIKACENEHEARKSFKKVVDDHGGRLTTDNIGSVYLSYLRKQQGKLAKQAEPMKQAA